MKHVICIWYHIVLQSGVFVWWPRYGTKKTKVQSPLPTYTMWIMCRNPSLGLTTKARAYKVASQEGSQGVTPHALGNVKKCEGMNPHTPKGGSTLGIWILVDSWIFRGWLQGSKPNTLKTSLYHCKFLET
jgi:hypothetical protein